MIDAFKKSNEERHTLEVQIPLEPESPFQTVQEAQENTQAKPTSPEETTVEEVTVVEEVKEHNVQENLTELLEALKQEESSLVSQKEQLVSIGEQLRLRTLDEIGKTKARISGLKSEIPDLKQKCEVMAKALQIPVCNTSD
jgi:hypothetical protein